MWNGSNSIEFLKTRYFFQKYRIFKIPLLTLESLVGVIHRRQIYPEEAVAHDQVLLVLSLEDPVVEVDDSLEEGSALDHLRERKELR